MVINNTFYNVIILNNFAFTITNYIHPADQHSVCCFSVEIILKKKNGLNVNPTYSNEMACAQLIAIIGDTLKQKTAADVGNAT